MLCRGVVTALKPVRAEQVRRPEPPVALGVRRYYPLAGNFFKKFRHFKCHIMRFRLSYAASADILKIFITVQFTLVQSAVLRSHVVHLSVCPSVRL